MKVYVIRHTPVAIEKGICYGQLDVPLASTFPSDFEQVEIELLNDFDRVYCSPLSRCSLLADYLAINPIYQEKTLMEMNFGAWEGQPWSAINQDHLNQWMADFVHVKPPGGENLEILYNRVSAFLDQLKNSKHEKVLIITHAGVIRCIWAYLLEIPLRHIFKVPVEFFEVFILNLEEDFGRCRIERKG